MNYKKSLFGIALVVLVVLIAGIGCTSSIRNGIIGLVGKHSGKGSQENLKKIAPAKIEPVKEAQKEAIVVIDPGHGGDDLGTVYRELYEKNLNLDISMRMGNILKKSGINIAYTRETDIAVELKDRAELANKLGATLFISVHNNKMPGSPDYHGTETLYALPQKQEEGVMDGERLATLVQRELVKDLKTYNNGIIYRPNLAVLRRTQMPAVIAEIAYVSNASDRAKLMTAEFRERAATALSNAVIKALGEMKVARNEEGKWVAYED